MKHFSTLLAGWVLAGAVCANEPTQLREVTVTAGTDAASEAREAISQKTILERKEIEALGGLTIGEIARKLPGIEIGEHGADGGLAARVRGLPMGSVQFLLNGERPTANPRFALTQIGRLSAAELERIEILRGASSEYGGAAAVTVNFVMRRPPTNRQTSLRATLGERGGEPNGQLHFSHGDGAGGFSWQLPVSVNRYAMPIDLARERTQLAGGAGAWQHDLERGEYAMNELVVSPRLSWKGQSGQFGLWPSLYLNDGERRQTLTRQQQTLPGGASVAAGGRRDDEDSAIRILRLRGEGETRLGENKLAARAAWMHGERTAQRRRATFAASGVTSGQWREDERREDDEFSVGLRLDRPLGTQHFFSMGAEFSDHRRQDRLQAVGTVGFGDDFSGRARQVGLWLQDEWRPEEALALTLGLRGEAVRLAAAGDARRHGHLSPSLALRWEPAAGWIARASAGGAMRFPKLEELTSKRDRSLAANTPLEPDLSGNPGLMPERIVNFEIGLDRQLAGNAGQLGANLYARRTRDFIEREVAFDGARWLARPENVGEARHWGLELSAKLNRAAFLPHGDGLRAQLTLPRGAVEDARRGVSRRPRELPRYVLTFAYEGSLPAWQSSWSLQWQRLGESRTDIPGFENQRLKRRDLVDLSVTRRLDAQLSLRLQLQNLFAAARENDGAAVWGADTWRLAAREPGKTSWLLSLEGKW